MPTLKVRLNNRREHTATQLDNSGDECTKLIVARQMKIYVEGSSRDQVSDGGGSAGYTLRLYEEKVEAFVGQLFFQIIIVR